ncbi:MAG: hypothetical protein N2749_02595 [Clostridia bacterium]|nr:hypothetical protein [Clostridia bacterium]
MEEKKDKIIKRIGTYTFGFTLILIGISIIVQTFFDYNVFRYILMLWPVVFITLGIEVLINSRKSNVSLQYDVFSILMVFVILFFGAIFGTVNYGVNKVLYNDDIKISIVNSIKDKEHNFSFENKLNIENLSHKKINYKVVERESFENTRVTVKMNYSPEFDRNIIKALFNENYIMNYINCDYSTGDITILKLPDNAESLDVIIYTNNKENVKYI